MTTWAEDDTPTNDALLQRTLAKEEEEKNVTEIAQGKSSPDEAEVPVKVSKDKEMRYFSFNFLLEKKIRFL